MTTRDDAYDLIGVGFGPSNLALAVRLAQSDAAGLLRTTYLERQPEFGWHRGMLLDDSRMQISFLKDLAMLRDPTSRFTFVNYLFEQGRLQDFVNLKQFYPTRIEFHDYLRWVARGFDDLVGYGEDVTSIEPVFDTRDRRVVTHVRVRSLDAAGRVRERAARALSIGIGGAPAVPAPFASLAARRDPALVHSSAYLSSIGALIGDGSARRRVAVIGGGQSAAEVFVDLTRRFPNVDATLIMRGPALRPADDSPFVNEIFNPSFTDVIYAQPDDRRRATLETFRSTNYSVVDRPLIESIYELFYMQRVRADVRHRLIANASIDSAGRIETNARESGIELHVRAGEGAQRCVERFDAVVLATGYRRDGHLALLEGLTDALGVSPARCDVTRDYRLQTGGHFQPHIYLQGCCEDTHGLSDTLLSVLACRADEIAASLLQRAPQPPRADAIRAQAHNGASDSLAAVAL
ncbi:lysine N(6)-hydroxylase/L-ornithine N(5)-oxygenase family protein [Trinickia diaoshuihuensis]|uniref:lysine N(6)-hydroxylase/L-ornithine N(5)-oxygenase family protein n=1 Tax=Trinickia diaoshuihuensis TaxID=2292265 RepID=UPI000E23E865|nr:lysine N(6)-hydroxylase/L-ornithine N(5)-oxygenase family protein [Trinickia diaoshuihuensis]